MTTHATAKEFNQERNRLLHAAQNGTTVVIENRGRAVASMVPEPVATSGAELGRRLAKMKPQPETAAAVAALIKGMDEAG
jgi:antitoxin (DNA-binding transcriptional repressor) of toxin-antitoxin stability system